MNEKQFHTLTDDTFLRIEAWIESTYQDIDFETQQGTLVVILPDQSQAVLSRQASLQEIWLAANQGAYHFQWKEDAWVTRKGELLWEVLEKLCKGDK